MVQGMPEQTGGFERDEENQMRTLERIIRRYIRIITLALVLGILVLIGCMEISKERKRAYENAVTAFHQIGQTLEQNQKELRDIGVEYSATCLYNAEAIAYMIQNNLSALESLEELKWIARFMEVDEIHIFDQAGCIYAGTHPEYYGYTFDSGEQMHFFKPMLEDKSLKLVQEVAPNTAEGKLMQYSALWSGDGQFIVQVGMAPVRLMKATEKNELSYIFARLKIDPAAVYYAIDMESGEIVGSTDLENVGKDLTAVGLELRDVRSEGGGFHARVNGVRSYCVFEQIGTNYVGRVMPDRILYQRLPANMVSLTVGLLLITFFLSSVVTWCMNRYVVEGIHSVNEKLRLIAGGDLEERVDIRSSVELSELSSYINEMIGSLLANNRKMSYALGKTNMYIGVYEYTQQGGKVRFTEHIPRIFGLKESEAQRLSDNSGLFREFLGQILCRPLQGEEGVFQLDRRYVKLEETQEGNETFGIAIDVTEEIVRRRKIEGERDMDALTGLYNRRGLEARLERLFAEPEKLGYYAVVMIDADGLKGINDTYGHDKGDEYLRKIADTINAFDPGNSLAARQGGDEFVLLLYQYEQEEELAEALRLLEFIQRHCMASLDPELRVRLGFSLGYVMARGQADYRELLRQADQRMYENKRERKKVQE